MGKKAPSAPDPAETAKAQGAANLDAAVASGILNNTNQITPYGSLTYDKIGTEMVGGKEVPRYQATTQLSPEQQQLLNLTNQAGIKYGQTANTQLGAVSDRLSQPLDFSSLGATPQANEQTRQATADSLYARLNPQLDRERAALETRLANQGITMGSEAWMKGMDDFSRSQNDARLAVEGQAGNEMARMFGLETGARNQAINEMVQQRQIPLNELAAMLTGSQVQSPSFVNTPQSNIAAPDIMGATYAGYNTAAQNAAAEKQGLYSLLGNAGMAAAFAWSDRRLKRDICVIGELANGLPVYQFRYNWSDEVHVGLMADEVREIHPDACIRLGEFYAVNYAEAVR